MTKNMGHADRLIRTLLAVVIIVLYITKVLTGTLAVVLGVIAIIFLLTSAIGVCPAYLPLKLSTLGSAPAPPLEMADAVPVEPEPAAAVPEPEPEPAPEAPTPEPTPPEPVESAGGDEAEAGVPGEDETKVGE